MASESQPQKILYVASHGMEDSYRATLIFAAAKAAQTELNRTDPPGAVRVALLGEATWLANAAIQQNFSLGAITYDAGGQTLRRGQLFELIADGLKLGVAIGV
jgi:hypothetical protein